MVEQIPGGELSSGFILIVGLCVLVVTPLVWMAVVVACRFYERDRHPDIESTEPGWTADGQASSKELALLIVGALEQNDIVQKEQFNDAVRIAVDRIQMRKALEVDLGFH